MLNSWALEKTFKESDVVSAGFLKKILKDLASAIKTATTDVHTKLSRALNTPPSRYLESNSEFFTRFKECTDLLDYKPNVTAGRWRDAGMNIIELVRDVVEEVKLGQWYESEKKIQLVQLCDFVGSALSKESVMPILVSVGINYERNKGGKTEGAFTFFNIFHSKTDVKL